MSHPKRAIGSLPSPNCGPDANGDFRGWSAAVLVGWLWEKNAECFCAERDYPCCECTERARLIGELRAAAPERRDAGAVVEPPETGSSLGDSPRETTDDG